MKVYLDNIVFSLQKAGGISKYWAELCLRLNISEVKSIFIEGASLNIFRRYLHLQSVKEILIASSIRRYLPVLKYLSSESIFHSSYYRISLQRSVANITTVHDFTYEKYRSGLARAIHVLQKKIAITYSDGIICVSRHTMHDLLSYYPGLDRSKLIRVIYNGISDEFELLSDSDSRIKETFSELAEKDYLVFVGSRTEYKNFSVAVDVLRNFSDLSLVVIGGGRFNHEECQYISDLNSRIYHYQDISNEELNVIYNYAFCLIYPSEYEGFGIPILEAMRAGCPVVSTNSSSIPEVTGNCAILVDTGSISNFCDAIRMLQSPEYRSSLIRRGIEWSRNFTWDRCYKETRAFYEEVWNHKFKKI